MIRSFFAAIIVCATSVASMAEDRNAPTVNLTPDEIIRHNAAVAASAVAQARISDAQDVENKITSAFSQNPALRQDKNDNQ